MTKRKSLSKKVRFEIFKRDSFTCQYCGNHPPKIILHVDHIMPVAKGGGNEDENLITSCVDCNQGKAANLLTNIPKSLKDKAAEIAESESQIAGYAKIAQAAKDRLESDCWKVVRAFDYDITHGYPKANFTSIKRFVRELGVDDVIEAAEISDARLFLTHSKTFRYFCGVCWNKINGVYT